VPPDIITEVTKS